MFSLIFFPYSVIIKAAGVRLPFALCVGVAGFRGRIAATPFFLGCSPFRWLKYTTVISVCQQFFYKIPKIFYRNKKIAHPRGGKAILPEPILFYPPAAFRQPCTADRLGSFPVAAPGARPETHPLIHRMLGRPKVSATATIYHVHHAPIAQ